MLNPQDLQGFASALGERKIPVTEWYLFLHFGHRCLANGIAVSTMINTAVTSMAICAGAGICPSNLNRAPASMVPAINPP